MRERIVVLDDWEHGLQRLLPLDRLSLDADFFFHDERLTGAALVDALHDATTVVLLRERTPVTRELLIQLPALKRIICTGARNRKLDVEATHERGITVVHTRTGPSKDSTAELTLCLFLAAAKRLPQLQLRDAQTPWRGMAIREALPGVLRGKRLGLIGLGDIGQRVAHLGHALGMNIVAWSPHLTPERAEPAGATAVPLDELLATSDVISLHLVPSPATEGLIDAAALGRMKHDAILVNTSRASLIRTADLQAALAARQIGMAALDVFDREPLDDAAWHKLDNVLLTPHLGFVAEPVFQIFADDITDILTGAKES